MTCALAFFAASARAAVFFHAALLRSTPASGAKLKTAPKNVRLVFSEEIVPSLSQVILIGPLNDSTKLTVTNDPHDVHTLVGAVANVTTGGRYTVYWRVVSADGHVVDGTIPFSLAGNAPSAPLTTSTTAPNVATQPNPVLSGSRPSTEEVPIVASLLRGFGLGAVMAAVGIFFFGVTGDRSGTANPRRLLIGLTAVGAILLVAHMVAWLVHISPPSGVSAQFTTSVLSSRLGRVELTRTVLAILTLAAAVLLRSWKPALLAGSACILLSAGIGHPAAIDPMWAIPAQAIHLLAGSLWLGGLIWILITARESSDIRQREALRISSLALVAVIAVGLSGLLQAVLFLNSPGDLLRSGYGKLVVAKIVGLLILLAYGAYNRFSLLPRFANGAESKLRTSVKQEVFLVSLLILIGGFLAYVPPPPAVASATSVSQGAQ